MATPALLRALQGFCSPPIGLLGVFMHDMQGPSGHGGWGVQQKYSRVTPGMHEGWRNDCRLPPACTGASPAKWGAPEAPGGGGGGEGVGRGGQMSAILQGYATDTQQIQPRAKPRQQETEAALPGAPRPCPAWLQHHSLLPAYSQLTPRLLRGYSEVAPGLLRDNSEITQGLLRG